MRTVAVVLAGGSGLRLGGAVPKQLQLLAGRTLLEHCVATFEQAPGVDEIVVVMPADLVIEAKRILADKYPKVGEIIPGGTNRPGSTRCAIDLLSRAYPATGAAGDPGPSGSGVSPDDGAPDDTVPPGASAAGGSGGSAPRANTAQADCNVLFHDAARPLVDQRIIADCVVGLAHYEALGVVVPTTDTIAKLANGAMTSIPPRESLGRCQTPQGFRLSVIRRAYQLAAADPGAAAFNATDDCGMVLRYLPDVEVRVVPGSERNLKITYPEDMRIAEAALADANNVGSSLLL